MIKKKKVLIVDDSALIRAVLSEIINSDPRLEVIEEAKDPYDAREKIKRTSPDVITLDVEMPKMNGIAFLKNLMRLRPMPVVMISTLTQEGAPVTLEALELGAVDFLPKPVNKGASALESYRQEIVEKVFAASGANVKSGEARQNSQPENGSRIVAGKYKPGVICAIGASTGGTEAIKDVIRVLPENSPPVVITQHIPAAFSASFARRVDGLSAMKVCEAQHNQPIEKNSVYIAPGSAHLKIAGGAAGYVCKLEDSEPVNRHKPSVDVMFDSVLSVAGPRAFGVLLTGMGADGAHALLRMRQAGCETAIQDEESSVVWGMPGSAYKLGASDNVMTLAEISRFIIKTASV